MRMRPAPAVGAIFLGLVAGTVGCSDSPGAGTQDETVTTSSAPGRPSEEPTSDESATDEAATGERTEETPGTPTPTPPSLTPVPGERPEITFVKHFFDVYMYARHTGDVEPFLELGTDNCESCISSAQWLTEKYKAGGYVKGGDYELREEPILTTIDSHPKGFCHISGKRDHHRGVKGR